ncbi:MAG: DNA methyltransferase, partial [Thermoanaerobaculia bacterium]|nr:DNA methyltransferase [Thermoanaerobaculia bacterium]
MIHGDCLDVMRTMPAASVDAVITDPPYGLKFMGKLWDHGVPGEQFWNEALRVAKPGAALLAFGGTRTFHRLACAIEDSGWRIYDCLSWMYGQGFPKHRTHLKPAWEPIVFAAKKGARFVNVEGCRVGVDPGYHYDRKGGTAFAQGRGPSVEVSATSSASGRWPANVVLDE